MAPEDRQAYREQYERDYAKTKADQDRKRNTVEIFEPHGFVRLVKWMGDELDIVNAARVSFANEHSSCRAPIGGGVLRRKMAVASRSWDFFTPTAMRGVAGKGSCGPQFAPCRTGRFWWKFLWFIFFLNRYRLI